MVRIRCILALFALAMLVLAGCGQKGPLYREDPEEEDQAQARQAPMVTMKAPFCNEYA